MENNEKKSLIILDEDNNYKRIIFEGEIITINGIDYSYDDLYNDAQPMTIYKLKK